MARLHCVSLPSCCRRAVSRRERDGNKLWKVRRKEGGGCGSGTTTRAQTRKRGRGGEPCIFAAFAPLMASVCFSQFVRYRWSPGIHRFARIFLPGFCPIPRSARGCTRRLESRARRGEDARTNGGHEWGPEKPSFYTEDPPLNANEREARERSRSSLWRRVIAIIVWRANV